MLKTSRSGPGMLKTSTLARMYWPLMELESVEAERCAVCGRAYPLERHHIVKRSAGVLSGPDGRPLPKPTVTLCGFGNNLMDADGRVYCHGAAHHGMLHFRNNGGRMEYLRTDPMPYLAALGIEDGWEEVWSS